MNLTVDNIVIHASNASKPREKWVITVHHFGDNDSVITVKRRKLRRGQLTVYDETSKDYKIGPHTNVCDSAIVNGFIERFRWDEKANKPQ